MIFPRGDKIFHFKRAEGFAVSRVNPEKGWIVVVNKNKKQSLVVIVGNTDRSVILSLDLGKTMLELFLISRVLLLPRETCEFEDFLLLGDEKYESITRSLDVLKEKIKEEIASDDYKSHYDLGIAYKEMGLIDEAIREFDLARGSDEFLITASLVMGLCYRQKGDLVSAEERIREGLERAHTDEQKMELWYELADILFQRGKHQECAPGDVPRGVQGRFRL